PQLCRVYHNECRKSYRFSFAHHSVKTLSCHPFYKRTLSYPRLAPSQLEVVLGGHIDTQFYLLMQMKYPASRRYNHLGTLNIIPFPDYHKTAKRHQENNCDM